VAALGFGGVGVEAGDEKRRLPAAGGRELRVREEGPPEPAHGAQAAQRLGRKAKQDLVQGIQWQIAGVGRGDSGHDAAPVQPPSARLRRRHASP